MTAELTTSTTTPDRAGTRPRPIRERAARWQRVRRLGGDDRAGTWSRAQARRLWWSFLHRQWWLVARMAGAAAALITVTAWVMPDGFVRGLVVGTGTTATLAAIALLTAQATGTAQLTAGSTAEQWTAQELRQLRAHGWRIVNHFPLENSDIDHVLIGPGGVLAAETKWSRHDWRTAQSRPWLAAAITQAEANARTLRLWLRASGIDHVTPVVFCWSAHHPDHDQLPTEPAKSGSSQLIYGTTAAATWRQRLTDTRNADTRLSGDQINRVWEALDNQIRRRDLTATQTTTSPPSLTRIYWTSLGILAAFTTGLLANLNTLTATNSWTVWTLVTVAQVAISLGALRAPIARNYAASWLIATTCGPLLALAGILGFTI